MTEFISNYKSQIIYTLVVLGVLFIVQFITRVMLRKIGRIGNKHSGRVKLVIRYITVIYFLLAILVIAFILGVSISNLVVAFSSVFAVLGITLFANWSVLSNVTSGIVMFFSFPYKIGDKIHIHDKDFDVVGIIEDIRSFQIHIRKENGQLATYPNNLILQKAVSLLEKDAFDK